MGGHAVACKEVSRDEMRHSDEMALDVIIRTTWTGSGRGQKGLTGLEFDKEPVLRVLKDAMTRVMRGPTEKKKKKRGTAERRTEAASGERLVFESVSGESQSGALSSETGSTKRRQTVQLTPRSHSQSDVPSDAQSRGSQSRRSSEWGSQAGDPCGRWSDAHDPQERRQVDVRRRPEARNTDRRDDWKRSERHRHGDGRDATRQSREATRQQRRSRSAGREVGPAEYVVAGPRGGAPRGSVAASKDGQQVDSRSKGCSQTGA